MPDLHLIGVQEDGRYLLLREAGSENEYRLPLDDALRAALRRDHGARPSGRAADVEPLRPRDVQAMIRAGASAAETAERAGWPIEKVHRYEGPILAERAHISTIAGDSHVRGRGDGPVTTLRDRVADRLLARGVEPESAEWDAWRSEDGRWTVELRFEAGGRARVASWAFSRSAMTADPVDDEARWLGGEDPAPARPATEHVFSSRPAAEPQWEQRWEQRWDRPAEAPRAPRRDEQGWDEREQPGHSQGHSQNHGYAQGAAEEPEADRDDPRLRRGPARPDDRDLMTDLRERSAAASRRRGPRRLATGTPRRGGRPAAHEAPDAPVSPEPPVDPDAREARGPQRGRGGRTAAETTRSPAHVPAVGVEPDVPLEPFGYDPGVDGPPPAAHPRPGDPVPGAGHDGGTAPTSGDDTRDRDTRDHDTRDAAVGSAAQPESAAEREPGREAEAEGIEHVTARRVVAPATHVEPELPLDEEDAPAQTRAEDAEQGRPEHESATAAGTLADDTAATPTPGPGTATTEDTPSGAPASAPTRMSRPQSESPAAAGAPADEASAAPAAERGTATPDDTRPGAAISTPDRAARPEGESPTAAGAPADETSSAPAASTDGPAGPGAASASAAPAPTDGPAGAPASGLAADAAAPAAGRAAGDLAASDGDRPARPEAESATDAGALVDESAIDESAVAGSPAPAKPAPKPAAKKSAAPRTRKRTTRSRAAAPKAPNAVAPSSDSAADAPPKRAPGAPSGPAATPTPKPVATEPAPAPEPTPEPRPKPTPAPRRKGRASVPSWDDIMFGAKHPDA